MKSYGFCNGTLSAINVLPLVRNWTCRINYPLASSLRGWGLGWGGGCRHWRWERGRALRTTLFLSRLLWEGNNQVHLSFVILIKMRSTRTVIA